MRLAAPRSTAGGAVLLLPLRRRAERRSLGTERPHVVRMHDAPTLGGRPRRNLAAGLAGQEVEADVPAGAVTRRLGEVREGDREREHRAVVPGLELKAQ